MRIPAIHGTIDRRILVNYRISPDAICHHLPSPFRPKLVHGYAIGGVCLIRLRALRPRWLSIPVGIASENAAHRFAVEWDVDGATREGVYIPCRHTNSKINALVGGRIFPGVHRLAKFEVSEFDHRYSVRVSDCAGTLVSVTGEVAPRLPASSVFESLREVSDFFARGSLGYSPSKTSACYDGLELACRTWNMSPLHVSELQSSFFDNRAAFPIGGAEFDCALVMHEIEHEWRRGPDLSSGTDQD